MRTRSIAETKARLSAVVDSLQAGEEVVITRHGHPVARSVAEPATPRRDPAAVLAEQRAFLAAPATRTECAADTVRQMRDGDRY